MKQILLRGIGVFVVSGIGGVAGALVTWYIITLLLANAVR